MRLGTSLKITELCRVAGGGAPAFSPSDISDMEAWWDPALGITLNGNDVSLWADQSGNGNTLDQSIAVNQPQFVASDANFNNHPTISFDGVTESLERATWSAGDLPQPFTVVLVVKSNSPGTSVDFYTDSFGGSSLRVLCREGSSGELSMYNGSLISSAFARLTTTNILYFQFDSATNNGAIYRDGVALRVSINCGNQGWRGISIGKRGSHSSNHIAMELGEILVYSKILSTTEKNDLGSYLQAKFDTATWTTIA